MNNLIGYIATGVVALVVGILLRYYFEPKSKLVWWTPHSFLFELRDPTISLYTHAHTIQNLGRKVATNIEIVHRIKPDYFKLEPALNYEEFNTPGGEHGVKIQTLSPKEFFTIEFLTYKAAAVPQLLYIRSTEGYGQPIKWQPQRVYPKPFYILMSLLLLVGTGFSIYWVIRAIIFISKSIGIF